MSKDNQTLREFVEEYIAKGYTKIGYDTMIKIDKFGFLVVCQYCCSSCEPFFTPQGIKELKAFLGRQK